MQVSSTRSVTVATTTTVTSNCTTCNHLTTDPETGRFINADDVSYLDPETIHGLNLYAYCGDNPVSNMDPYGTAWFNTFWDHINTLAGFLNPVSKITAIGSIVVALFQGRWNDLESDWNNGCLNPFNQSESIALKSKILSFYKGSTVVRQNIFGTCSALGTIWLNQSNSYATILHEYGHSVQERILGGAYWITIAVPSVIYWFYDKQNRSDYNYFSTPWERSADWLGGVNRPTGYKPNSLVWSILENILGPIVIPFYFIFGF